MFVMQKENWHQVKQILDEVLSLETSERQNFLNFAKLQPDILSEVNSLLAFETEAEDLMRLSAVEYSNGFFDDTKNALVGQNIGVYKIIRELGYGGMGAVYLAERTDGKFEQKVALKLLKREMNTAAIRRRFAQEREILASLKHPNIASLLDAGTTDDKIPYIAMEYVEGLPIDDYCNKNGLNVEQRLDLFREVCATVDFAHRNLVVHRDLKPSNILINSDGSPKLLDFGISKILSEELDQKNTATVTKMGVMTPSYASPEQLQNKSVTTATDIYSLGVILYEFLSGHRPFETKESDIKEIYKAVIEIDPPLPSAMANTFSKQFKQNADEKTPIVAEKKVESSETEPANIRHTSPQILNLNSNSIRGDLDNIVLKALRKEPERRYLSAENLSEDIKRHLRGLPVTARPNTFSYRAEKFINRNKVSVFAGFLIILAIFGGIGATLWQARIARAEKTKAERRFNDVRQLANSFLFDLSPKIEKLPGSTEARRELVTLALQYLDSLSQEAGDDPQLQQELAAAYEKVGDVQGKPSNPNIGDIKGAIQSYEKALAIRRKLLEKEPDNQSYQDDLAQNYTALGEINANGGDYDKGQVLIDNALEIRRNIISQNPQDFDQRAKFAEVVSTYGDMVFLESEFKKAIEYFSQANELFKQLHDEQPADSNVTNEYAESFVKLGESQGWDNDPKTAEVSLEKGLNILVPLGEQNPNDQNIHRSIVKAYQKTAANYIDIENFEKGVELSEKGVAVAEKISKADPNNVQAKRDLAVIVRKLAFALDAAGRNKESLDKLFIVSRMFEDLQQIDPDNFLTVFDIANTEFTIAGTYWNLENHQAALEILRKSDKHFYDVLRLNPEYKDASRMTAITASNIGSNYAELAKKGNQREFLQNALEYKLKAKEIFKKLKSEGNLAEFDNRYIEQNDEKISEIRSQLES